MMSTGLPLLDRIISRHVQPGIVLVVLHGVKNQVTSTLCYRYILPALFLCFTGSASAAPLPDFTFAGTG